MESKPRTQIVSPGQCLSCHAVFDKEAMTQHLASCPQRLAAIEAQKKHTSQPQETRLLHILAEGLYNPQYWLHFEISETEKFELVDALLKNKWVDDYGHQSAFETKTSRIGMYDPLSSVLKKVGQNFSYTYDFGSSTYITLKVIAKREGIVPPENQSIPLLAQNTAPEFKCIICGKAATQVKMEDVRNGLADATYCNACAEDQYEEDMRPLINSPRVGVL